MLSIVNGSVGRGRCGSVFEPRNNALVTPDGRVKLRPTAVVGAQHGGFTAGSSPASWGSIDECCVNWTIPDEDLVSVPDVAQPALSTREPAGVG